MTEKRVYKKLTDVEHVLIRPTLYVGDVNNDSNIDIFDIIVMLNFILGNIDFIDYQYADINHDGSININDIILMVNYILMN